MSLGFKGLKRHDRSSSSATTEEPPPPYSRERQSARADRAPEATRPLDLRNVAGPPEISTSTRDECIAHLKLLAAFADLRDAVGKDNDLFGISNREIEKFSNKNDMNKAAAILSEKRWAVYVTRAVERFTVWWQRSVPICGIDGSRSYLTTDDVDRGKFLGDAHLCPVEIDWTPSRMPPLDVVMVWHAYMLNPRDFLEDCIRHSRMSFWATGLPWKALDACINPSTFDYTPHNDAKSYFENLTGLSWDNLDGAPMKIVSCPKCQKDTQVPWTEGSLGNDLSSAFENCTGYADKNLKALCPSCGFTITHEALRLKKFRRDVQDLLRGGIPMPGTILSLRGAAENAPIPRHPVFFPNRLIKEGIRQNLLEITDPSASPNATVSSIRDEFEKALKTKSLLRQANDTIVRSKLYFGEKVAVRRMMSRYWENSSFFALDLVGAVIRQGVFVVKMDEIDWLHSPNLDKTMARLLKKYYWFWRIMGENPGKIAVPTLDVDLAWHTHQLSPKRYYNYSITNANNKFIDHDDKIDENKLSDAFKWTSKQYQKLTDGELYSECTCWYCEAVRESHNTGIFTSFATSQAREKANRLHDERGTSSSNNDANPHISAHNAVRMEGNPTPHASEIRAAQLRAHYERAVRRHEKRKGNVIKNKSAKKDGDDDRGDGGDRRSRDAYVYAWGYPYPVMPIYGPYMCDPTTHGGMYPCNPSCMNANAGAAGNCVAGACGAGVASGACAAGGAGACASGAGCGGGACGGGGGGGCGGGGGGGGGCGGGGGGGGC